MRGTQEGNGRTQKSRVRPKFKGQSGGGQPAETALAGQPSAGRWWVETGRSEKYVAS